jgi:hypothetical protein
MDDVVAKATAIITSNDFKQAFKHFMEDTEESEYDVALKQKYYIRFYCSRNLVTAFAGVLRDQYPNTLFLNPLMLHNMSIQQSLMKAKSDSAGYLKLVKMQTLFLVVKVVHVMTHLLDVKVSP